MHSAVAEFVKFLRIPRRILSSGAGYITTIKMAGLGNDISIFNGKKDRFNGVTVDSKSEPCDINTFTKCLKASLDQWIAEERRAIWFRVNLEHSDWIPVLTKNGFQFHHAKNEYVTLYRWLPVHQSCNVPPYAHTLLGVGALVFNENTEEVLVVKEKYSIASQMWKLPGGYVEPGEDIAIAAQREVMEETGIEAEFKQLLLFRHAHHFAFDCSDIYMVVCLTPRTLDITRCEREIAHCTWMKLEEYVNHPEVHEHNRLVARKFIELRSHKTGVVVENMIHPSLKKPVSIFSISKMEN
ncbi:nudix hydrolase 7 isoform X1 [Athalia rosae]|uniref:nudix hydrolase 7 isoform X1 n=1 Tax=Athalia rosae TaxID=37344 RepID=UPI0020343BD2|nr:nudix hydrolase 7 isoform X1 [Athalia rosae]